MGAQPLKVTAITLLVGILFAVILLGFFLYRRKYLANAAKKDKGVKSIRHRPTPFNFDKVRFKRISTPQPPPVITPSTPNQFTIPPRRYSPDDTLDVSPSFPPRPTDDKAFPTQPVKLLRTISEPHGRIECYLRHDDETNSLFVQILGKKGHSLSWLTGISNPYIRVTLTAKDHGESSNVLTSQILNLPLNPECQLEGITKEDVQDCLLKFVVLDFDRFSRSEFVADVTVPLGELENLCDGVTVCKDLIPQQEVMCSPRGSLLISLCNQSVAQQLQVIIMKADGIPTKSSVSLAGSDLCVKTTLDTSEMCQKRKTKGLRGKTTTGYIFNERLLFEVKSEDLTNASLVFEVTRGDSKLRSETKVGLVKLGLNSTLALEMRHWSEILASPQKQVAEWHQLHR